MDFRSTVFSPALVRRGVSYGVHPSMPPHLEGGSMVGAYLSDPDPDSGLGMYQPGLGALALPGFLSTLPPPVLLALIAGGSWWAARRMHRKWPYVAGAALAYMTLGGSLTPTAPAPPPAGG